MPRGWKPAEDLAQAFWKQILRGPRPPSVTWPAARGKGKGKGKGKGHQPEVRPEESGGRRNRRWQARAAPVVSLESRRTPDELVADNQAQIDRLERAIAVLGENSTEAAGLVASLKKLRAQSVQPVGVRLDACQQFVERARKRFAAAEDAVMKALQTKSRLEFELEEGLAQVAASPRGSSCTTEGSGSRSCRGPSDNSSSVSGGGQPIARYCRGSAAREGSVAIRGVPPASRGASESVSLDVDVDQPGRHVEQRHPVQSSGVTCVCTRTVQAQYGL